MSHQLNNDFTTMNEEQRKDPLGNLLDVVGHETLYDLRRELFYMFERAATNTYYDDESGEELRDQFWHFELFLKCVERLYRIYNMIEARELTYSYHPKTTNNERTR
jgi:hypothetical protein